MGGLAAARALSRSPVPVTVVDSRNYSTFQPLLFQAAVGVISPEDVARPVRSILNGYANVTFRVGDVVGADWESQRLQLAGGDELAFDYLILATGVMASTEALPGAPEHAVPLKSVGDATRLRNSVLRSFEAAAAHPELADGGATTIAIVGGGSTGVELAGYLADILFRSFDSDYPSLARDRMRVVLVEAGGRLLPAMHPKLGRYAEEMLRRRGVDVRLNTGVTAVDPSGVTLDTEERILAATTVWAGGVAAPAWVRGGGLATDHGRVVVDPDLRVSNRSRTFAIGDVAAVCSSSGELYPQVAQVAIQGGHHVARQICRLIDQESTEPFRYLDKGSMAVVGCYAAVVQSGPVRLTGRLAWVAWGLLHLFYLPGAPNRMSTAQKWRWWHVTHEATTRLLTDEPGHATLAETTPVTATREFGSPDDPP
jgi:NADH:quinone reductase (non-electrogenic)